MAEPNGTSLPTETPVGDATSDLKGKGKAVDPSPEPQIMVMEEDDSSSEESGKEEPEEEPEEDDDDNMEEIDTENIVGGRTRGKKIDYAAADRMAREAGEDVDDDDDEDDDFEEPPHDDPMEE